VSASGSDHQLIRRARVRATVQIAVLFAGAVLLLDVLAAVLVQETGHADARRQVAQAVADQDALTKPPRDVWIFVQTTQGLRTSPGAPAQPPAADDLVATHADRRRRDRVVHRAGREYQVRTEPVAAGTVQVALDITEAERERRRLFVALAAAGVAGLMLAVALGAAIARRSIAPLGEALARQERFVADASHELRTPLTQLHTRAQLLERGLSGGADAEQVQADARALVAGTRHLGDIVQELLLAAQMRAEPVATGPVDLVQLARDAVEAESARAQRRGVEMAVQAAGPVAPVRGLATPLRRVLAALLDNALAHTPAGGHVWVRLSGGPDGSTVTCVVEDDGEGFPPGDQEAIFERFARGGHGDRRRFGLGLALVREVVRAHGGSVRAEGRPGEGATFTLVLPAWRPGQ
jgi:two-component system, OmpR family, sensor kinase